MALRSLHDIPAPAKLNLFLHVVGRRPDGYHLLQSHFVLIDWADTLHFERRDDGVLRRRDLGPALPADDLCLRAARALQDASGCAQGVDIAITKQVPWGAGLGGGSSDAATTLLALNRLWGLNWPRTRLAQIGLRLGADVPFFIGGTNAFVEGIGEKLLPVATEPAWYAVVKPPGALATRDIFEHPMMVRNSVAVIVAGSPEDAGLGGSKAGSQGVWVKVHDLQDPGFGRNDLQAAAEDCCSEVAQAARWLEARYGNSRMTGSGSAVFARAGMASSGSASIPAGISADSLASPLAAEPAAGPFSGLPPGWVGRICRGLAEHPLRGWAD